MLGRMQLLGVRVYRADKAFDADGVTYPAGTWVIPMTQPFALFVKNLFEEQQYPDLAKHPYAWQALVSPQKFPDAYLPPYDMGGWTLSYQMGARVVSVNSPLDVPLTLVEKVQAPEGGVARNAGSAYLISSRLNNAFTAVNRILKAGGEVHRARDGFASGGESYPPGTFVIPSRSVTAATMNGLAKELSLPVGGATSTVPNTYRQRAPRVGLYKPWLASMDEGWTRWLLEQFEFDYVNIHNAEIRAGELDRRIDVLVIPSMSIEAIMEGHKPGTIQPQYAGGITEAGVRNIKTFVEKGGTLILLNNAALFGIEKLGLPVVDALKDLQAPARRDADPSKPVEFACPGSVLRMKFDTKHPVAYGMPEEGGSMFIRSPAFSLSTHLGQEKTPQTIASYPDGNLLMSGFLKGEKHLTNKRAALDVEMGQGRVILLGFGVQQRAQPHGTFKLLFNSLYYGTSHREGGAK
jgi:hypothetical protein